MVAAALFSLPCLKGKLARFIHFIGDTIHKIKNTFLEITAKQPSRRQIPRSLILSYVISSVDATNFNDDFNFLIF